MTIKVTDIFNQTGQKEYGIPDHWCVQYYTHDSEFCKYSYHKTKAECLQWVTDNCSEEYNNYAF